MIRIILPEIFISFECKTPMPTIEHSNQDSSNDQTYFIHEYPLGCETITRRGTRTQHKSSAIRFFSVNEYPLYNDNDIYQSI